jgi:hypothetical protein
MVNLRGRRMGLRIGKSDERSAGFLAEAGYLQLTIIGAVLSGVRQIAWT